jgi:outer membrane protein assembly factor BamA
MSFDARVRQGSANIVLGSGTVWPDEARLDARFSGTLNEPARLAVDVPVGGVVNLQVAANGPFDALTARGTIVVDDASYDTFRLGRLDATIALDAAAAHLAVTSDEFGARATAAMTRDGTRRAALDLQVDGADLARVLRDATLPVGVTGRLSLRAHAEGVVDDWRQGTGDVEVSQLEVIAGELPINLTGPARATYEDRTIEVQRLDAAIGGTDLSVAGRLAAFADAEPVTAADALRATLIGDVGHALAAVRATGLVDVPDVRASGPLVLLARLTGSAGRPILAGDVELGPGSLALDPASAEPNEPGRQDPTYVVAGLQLRAHVENGWLDLLSASADWQGSRISAEGRAPLRLFDEYLPQGLADAAAAPTGQAVLTAQARSITPQVLAPFVGPATLSQIEGSIDASARLSAASIALEDLEGELRLDTLAIRAAGLPVSQREPTRIVFEDGFARVAAWDWVGQGASLNVQGQVRLSDRDAVIRAAGRIDLQMLTPFVREAGIATSGTLTPLVAITGPLDDPAVNAEVTLADGGFRLVDPRVIATDVRATAVVSQLAAEITALTGFVNGGALTGGGRADYGGPEPPSARLGFKVAGMALELPDGLRSELDADLNLALTDVEDVARGTLSGTVTVLRSAYREPLAVVTSLLAALRSERLAAAVTEPDSLADRLALDVRVVTDSDVIVDNNLARLQLAGDLRLIGTAAAPALSGRATLREGGELFLGANRYSIDSGTIDFQNAITIEPDMNIQARTRAGGEEIELTLKGTPETLSVDLRAPNTPELGQADLASLLLTGRTLDDVSGAEGQIVGEQVLSYLSGDVLGAASRVVGLDTIRLGGVQRSTFRRDASAIATETDPTSRLTFGKSLGEQLEITLSQSLRSGDAQTWLIDYTPLSQILLRLVSDDENLRAYEFRHDVTFGSPAAPLAGAPRREVPDVRVTAVELGGNPGAFEGELRGALRLGPGDTFDFTEWQRDRDRLEQWLQEGGRREARVTATRTEDASGIALSYEIDPGPATAIVVTGYSLPRETLQALEVAWTESVLDDLLEEEAAAIVRRTLAEDGYLRPEVASEILTGDTKRLAITIMPGDRTLDRRIAISTADEALARDLDRWIRNQGLNDIAWRDPDALERAITAYLQSRGHLTATAAAAPVESRDGTGVLAITVEPGPVFTMGDVQFTGAERVALDTLQEAADLPGGATAGPNLISDARARVLRRYRNEGFTDARVTVEQRVDSGASRVNVVFAVEEGPRQVVRDVTVAGARDIDTDVVTRALDLEVGEPLGAEAWLAARSRLFDTALFRRVDVTTTPLPDAPVTGEERPVRVQATVQEWPALRLRYGFQISEERPEGEVEGRDLVPGVSADLERRTLFGRAITSGAVLQYQRRDRTARLFANAPTMFGLPVESLITGYRSRQEFVSTTLLTDRTGASWEQRIRIVPALRLSYSYTFDRDHTFETEPDPDSIFPEFDVTVNVARINAAAVFDTRDDPLDTARGLLLSSSLDYASERFGSDVSFVSHLAQAYYFQPWRQVVFASAARVGLVTPLGGQPLIPSERYFGGGSRTVRGVREDGLGPRDFEGESAGGGALVVFNHEVRFPIYRWVRGVAFGDIGNVFTAPSAIDPGDLVGSLGGGLRVITPFALLRVDYGRVVAGTGESASGRWTFGIGHTF